MSTPTESLLTLTTCNPRWASTERLIVFGHLEETTTKAAGRPTALAGEGLDVRAGSGGTCPARCRCGSCSSLALLVAAVVLLLFTVVFPWAEHALPFFDVTVDQ